MMSPEAASTPTSASQALVMTVWLFAGVVLIALVLFTVFVARGSEKTEYGPREPVRRVKKRGANSGLEAGRWGRMSTSEKALHMNDVVLPRMTAVFQQEDAVKYARVDCGFCHPAGVVTGDFKMPDSGLPRFESYPAVERDAPEMLKFMERVEKAMALSLGVPVYDPDTHKGVQCSTCHVVGNVEPEN